MEEVIAHTAREAQAQYPVSEKPMPGSMPQELAHTPALSFTEELVSVMAGSKVILTGPGGVRVTIQGPLSLEPGGSISLG
jgi:hypothetical protein